MPRSPARRASISSIPASLSTAVSEVTRPASGRDAAPAPAPTSSKLPGGSSAAHARSWDGPRRRAALPVRAAGEHLPGQHPGCLHHGRGDVLRYRPRGQVGPPVPSSQWPHSGDAGCAAQICELGCVGCGASRVFGPLAERPFRLLWLAATTSAVGSAFIPVALAFAVLGLHGTATSLGLVLLTGTIAGLLGYLVGGVWADRISRRTLMIAADLLRLVVESAVAVLLLTGHSRIWELACAYAITQIASSFFDPASTSLVAEIVAVGRLQKANSLLSISRSATSVAGPALSGVLVATAGLAGRSPWTRRRSRAARRSCSSCPRSARPVGRCASGSSLTWRWAGARWPAAAGPGPR